MLASSKVLLYKDLMSELDYRCHAWYLENIDRDKVNTITRFRLRNHRLSIEVPVGDWIHVPVENRACYSCMVVEDEAHFVYECPRYADLRAQYILQIFMILEDAHRYN